MILNGARSATVLSLSLGWAGLFHLPLSAEPDPAGTSSPRTAATPPRVQREHTAAAEAPSTRCLKLRRGGRHCVPVRACGPSIADWRASCIDSRANPQSAARASADSGGPRILHVPPIPRKNSELLGGLSRQDVEWHLASKQKVVSRDRRKPSEKDDALSLEAIDSTRRMGQAHRARTEHGLA